jgi:hypothetical protein
MAINTVLNPIVDINQLSENGIPSYTVSTGLWNTGSNITYSPTSWTADTFTVNPAMTVQQSGKIELKGPEADIEINGKSLVEALKRIEERINILTVNTELEAEWEELRELGNQYRALEQRIKDKMETWNKLCAEDQDNR